MENDFTKLHQCIADTETIIQTLNSFNETVHSAGMYFRLDVPDEDGGIAYPNNEIPDKAVIVIGSFDFSYYHQIEIVFSDAIKVLPLPKNGSITMSFSLLINNIPFVGNATG